MFISVMEFVPLMAFFIWEKTSTLDKIYSLITLFGTPLIYHLGMEDNRNNDIAHAKNTLKIFEKKKSKNELEEDQSQREEIKDDVRLMDISEDKDVDDQDHIHEELQSSTPTQDKTPLNVEPEPEKPTKVKQPKERQLQSLQENPNSIAVCTRDNDNAHARKKSEDYPDDDGVELTILKKKEIKDGMRVKDTD